MPPIRVLHTEPYGSVCPDPLRCLVRRTLGRHPTRRSGATRPCRRFDQDLAEKFHMTLTGMKKHVGVLERAGLVATEKVGRVRTCKLSSRRLVEEMAWIEEYRQLWASRFDELDRVVEELKQKERVDGRKRRK